MGGIGTPGPPGRSEVVAPPRQLSIERLEISLTEAASISVGSILMAGGCLSLFFVGHWTYEYSTFCPGGCASGPPVILVAVPVFSRLDVVMLLVGSLIPPLSLLVLRSRGRAVGVAASLGVVVLTSLVVFFPLRVWISSNGIRSYDPVVPVHTLALTLIVMVGGLLSITGLSALQHPHAARVRRPPQLPNVVRGKSGRAERSIELAK